MYHAYLTRIQLANGKCRWDYGAPLKCSWKRLALRPLLVAEISWQLKVLKWWKSSKQKPKLEILYPVSIYYGTDATCPVHVYKFCLAEKSYSEAGQHIPFHRHQHPSGLHQNCRHHSVISGKQPALLKLDKLYNINIYASLLKRLQYHNWHCIWHLWLTRVTFTLMEILSSL